MGFDNECILNIQSLAGEYFCPVCRLLVYPNEALQSQCTHLYCKPCLTYIVATTRACPYDGYLVTEADSKPLSETNKPLAETIGNIAVHCLYHRSGCQWQGSLSACVAHCATCAFGNSPVVCNRCAVHIVHRQVQDHAQTCSGAPAQPQTGVDQAQPAVAAVVPENDANQQAQALAQASAEQYYQQQLYQQYHQQYYQQQQQPQQHVVASNAAGQPAAVSHLQAPVMNQVTTQQQQSYPQPQVQHQAVPQQPYAQYQQPQAQQQIQMQTQLNYLVQSNNVAQNPAAIAMAAHPNNAAQNPATQQYYVPPQSQLVPKMMTQRPQQVLFQQSHASVPIPQQQQQSLQRPYFQQRPVQQTFPRNQVAAPLQLRPMGTPHGRPQFLQNPVGRPSMPGQGIQSQPQAQFLGGLSRPVYHQDSIPRPPSQNQSGVKSMPAVSAKIDSGSKPVVVAEAQAEISGSVPKPVDSDNKVASEDKAEQGSTITAKENEEPIKQEGDVENKLNHSNIGKSHEVVSDENKDALEEGSEKNKQSATTVVEKKSENGLREQHEGQGGHLVNDSICGSENGSRGISIASAQIRGGYPEHSHPTLDQGKHQPLAYHHGPTSLPQRPYSSGELPPPPPIFDSRAGTMARSMNPNQRPFFMDARKQPNPTFPSSLEHGKLGFNMKGETSFDPMWPPGSRREFPHLQAERHNSFPAGPNLHMPDRVELLHDMKRFPRPGSVPSLFLSRHDVGPSSYSGERRVIHHEDPFARMEPNRSHLDFLDRRHFESLASRSLGREHLGMSLRGFPRPDLDEFHGRELRRLGEPFLGSFPENRYSLFPSHLRRGEFEAPGRMGLGDRFRNDVIGHDGVSSLPRGRERIGHHNMYEDFHLRETANFSAHSVHARTTDIGRSAIDLFGGGDRPRYPSLGEPGFRSNISMHEFPNDGRVTTVKGELDFDRKRKAPAMGWCRICKVDCETVEGLDLHAQTREHQKMAMDVVATIKKNAKKKKLQIGEQSSPRDTSKAKNSSNGEDLGKN